MSKIKAKTPIEIKLLFIIPRNMLTFTFWPAGVQIK